MKRPEQALQRAVCEYLDRQYPGLLYFHVPNGGKRSRVEGAIFKSIGVKAGVPDLFFFWSDAAINACAAIELKADKGTLKDNQKAMIKRLNDAGVEVAVCRSVEGVRETLEGWGVPKHKRSIQVEW